MPPPPPSSQPHDPKSKPAVIRQVVKRVILVIGTLLSSLALRAALYPGGRSLSR
jgi:hypothetical protein